MANVPPLFGIGSFRTSFNSRINVQDSNLQRVTNRLLELETQLATGFRVNAPSDDPLAAIRALFFRREIDQGNQYVRNISLATAEANTIDDALGSFSEIVVESREIMIASQDVLGGQFRSNAANQVDLMLRQAVDVANRKFQGKYVFAGRDGSRPVAEILGPYVKINTTESSSEVNIADGVKISRNISAQDAFGAFSSEVSARVDLNPDISTLTKLGTLNGGRGVRLGSILVNDGLGNQSTINLSGAESVADVLTIINADGTVTAAINATGNGIQFTAAGANISVSEVNNGLTSVDLGILQSSAGATLTGGDVNPELSTATAVTDLVSGAGIDLSGITVTNGADTKNISFAGAQTVEDILNAINLADIHVVARINDAGTGIDVRSNLNGARFTITENGGTSAADLGLLLNFVELC